MEKLKDNKEELNKKLEKWITPRNEWTPVDEALFIPKEFYNINSEKAEELKLKAIKYSFKHHYTNNYLYHRLCEAEEIKPDDIKNLKDLVKIPLIPDTFFKDYPDGIEFVKWLDRIFTGKMPNPVLKNNNPSHDDVIDALDREGINILFTSGTSGRFSFVPRDKLSENRLKYSWIKSLFEMSFAYEPDADVIILAPNPFKTHLTIARVFGYAFDLFDKSRVHVAMKDTVITTEFLNISRGLATGISGKLKSKVMGLLGPAVQKKSDSKMIDLLEKLEEKGNLIGIAGPPFWLDRITSRMKEEGREVSLAEGSQVLTGGGWKIYEDKRSPEEVFREKVEKILGISEDKYGDAYAMTECNSLFMSCDGHYKHIPTSLIHTFVLDEELQPLGYDEYGRLAFLDPLSNSYPGFIITGDRIKILEHCPECGRPGPVLDTEITRLPGVEGRGCALVMQEMMKQSIEKE